MYVGKYWSNNKQCYYNNRTTRLELTAATAMEEAGRGGGGGGGGLGLKLFFWPNRCPRLCMNAL